MLNANEPIHQFEPLWGSWHADELLGEGGYGKVYRIVRQDESGTFYSACKHITIPKNDAEVQNARQMGMDERSTYSYFGDMASRIVKEINIMYSLKGENNIVSYEDHMIVHREGSLKWDIFIRMELLFPLSTYVADNPMDPEEVRRLGIEICTALEACARVNVIHRDIKEGNVFLNSRGTFKLGDFGIARDLSGAQNNLSMRGTPAYVAPEVYNGQSYDATVDIYSLGLLMYKLINQGRYPFFPPASQPVTVEHNDRAFILRMQGAVPAWPVQGDDALRSAVMKAISFRPQDRFASATDMKAVLLGRKVVDVPVPVPVQVQAPSSPMDSTMAFDPTRTPGGASATQASYSPQAQFTPQTSYTPQGQFAPQNFEQTAGISPAPAGTGTGKGKLSGGAVAAIVAGGVLLVALVAVLLLGGGGGTFVIGSANKYEKATLYEKAGDYEEALALFEKIPAYEDSADHILSIKLIQIGQFVDSGDYSQAQAAIDALAAETLSSERQTDLSHQRARLLFYTGDFTGAFQEYNSLVSTNYGMTTYEDSLCAEICAIIAEDLSAEEAQTLLTDFSNDRTASVVVSQAVYDKAAAALESRAFDDAQVLFEALGNYKDSLELVRKSKYLKASAAMENGEYETAIELFSSVQSYEDASSLRDLCSYRLACEQFEQGDYSTSFDVLSDLILADFEPDDAFLQNNAAAIYAKAEEYYYSGQYYDAANGFITVYNYERSMDYLSLANLHASGVGADALETLLPLIGFADANDMLMENDDIAIAFLAGKWTCGSGDLSMRKNSNGGYTLSYGLPAFDFGDSFVFENSSCYFTNTSTGEHKEIYRFHILSEDKIEVYSTKSEKTYTMKRS